jgi:hypothetical protein
MGGPKDRRPVSVLDYGNFISSDNSTIIGARLLEEMATNHEAITLLFI